MIDALLTDFGRVDMDMNFVEIVYFGTFSDNDESEKGDSDNGDRNGVFDIDGFDNVDSND